MNNKQDKTIYNLNNSIDIQPEQLLKFLKDKSKTSNEQNNIITFDFGNFTISLDHKQRNDTRFLKSLMLSLVLMNSEFGIGLNELVTKNNTKNTNKKG